MLPNVGVPDTFAYATAFAVAANDTSPVTFAPIMFEPPPKSAVTRPVVVIVLEPNAAKRDTTFALL